MGYWVREPLKKPMPLCKPKGGGMDMLTSGAASDGLTKPKSYE